jgi:hypothetical protein
MLAGMIEGWVLWLVLAGLAIGVFAAWLLLVRLPREEDDVSTAERRDEAEWIAATIERHGGVAPRPFVEEVLDLHQAYLRSPRAAVDAPLAQPPTQPPPAQPPPAPMQPPPGAPPATAGLQPPPGVPPSPPPMQPQPPDGPIQPPTSR